MKSLSPKLKTLAKRIVNPDSQFEGRQHGPICEVDNILVFNRLTRTELQQKSIESNLHHRHVLFFNLAASGFMSLDGVQLRLQPGDGVLVLPYQFHSFPMIDAESILWVMVSFETPTAEMLEVFRNKVFRCSESAHALLAELISDFSEPASPYGNIVGALKVSLLLHTCGELLKAEHPQSVELAEAEESKSAKLVTDIESILLKTTDEMVSVEYIAKELGVSASHLRATFRTNFNISLGSFIRHFRLNQSVGLLMNTEMSLAEISTAVGFSSPSAFSRFFRNSIGVTPKDYRKEAATS